jgi:hypothetical protein
MVSRVMGLTPLSDLGEQYCAFERGAQFEYKFNSSDF